MDAIHLVVVGETQVRLEPQKNWRVTRKEPPSRKTSSRSKSRDTGAKGDKDMDRGMVWTDAYIS